MPTKPTVLVFDVNETLIDLASLEPFFAARFGDVSVMRQWFAELIVYAEAVALSEIYVPFGALAKGCLRMVGDIRGVEITEEDAAELGRLIGSMPPHPDVAPALDRLASAGFRMVTLTNSASGSSPSPLEKAGLAYFFERAFTVEATERFKPARVTYDHVSRELGRGPEELCLVACHVWDTIGAQAAGWQAGLLMRPGNAVLKVDGVPRPTFVADDLGALTDMLLDLPARD
ncbi:MAG: haloacid dehalogenase type II [Pseudomonadota bacterium]